MRRNRMCRAVNCKSCNKTTWAGCGNHVDEVMRHIPKAERCSCDRNAPKSAAPKSAAPKVSSGGWFSRLFGGK